jgi:hypothetical protein
LAHLVRQESRNGRLKKVAVITPRMNYNSRYIRYLQDKPERFPSIGIVRVGLNGGETMANGEEDQEQ